MDADLVKTILSVVVSSIPLVIIIISVFRGRIERTTEPLDETLKVLNISRYPVDNDEWNVVSRKNVRRIQTLFAVSFCIFLLSLCNIIYSLVLLVSSKNSFSSMSFYYNIISLVMMFLIVIASLRILSYIERVDPKNSYDARYNIFKDVDIIIECDYHYLFNKCHDALRNMNIKVAEVSEQRGILEAYHGTFAGITLQIEKVKDVENGYKISVSLSSYKKAHVNAAAVQKSSLFINRFINQLISKRKGADQKAESKADISSDVGD